MLDINQFIEDKGGNPELIRKSQKARGASVELVDEIISDYKEWVKTRFDLDELNKKLVLNSRVRKMHLSYWLKRKS